MIISTKGRYALRLMMALAGRKGNASLREIAAEEQVSYKYAEAIAATLMKAGFVQSSRGKNGGYCLTRAPGEYTLAEILKETESSLAVTECTENKQSPCPKAATCSRFPIWRELDEMVFAFLSRYTLYDLLPPEIQLKYNEK